MTAQVEALNIVYTGKALDTHKMDILALAQSLKGLGDALYEANILLNGDEKFEVNVDAELIAGSFGFQLQVVQHLSNAKDVLKLFWLKGFKDYYWRINSVGSFRETGWSQDRHR
ncbi:Uncharacterised protein [Klebsiella michiganensis]|uniref:Uncharacterized protein n=1 Tax=Klebsiella michiganensis TaxID=1134687 RepID=A0A7H4N5P1_9ENTR|nr:Uncharacterised protein [Klebsiella michiganensis]